MKRSAKFYLSFIFMILFSVASVFAQDWYVCLGSFKTQYYADSMMDALNEAGYIEFYLNFQSLNIQKAIFGFVRQFLL